MFYGGHMIKQKSTGLLGLLARGFLLHGAARGARELGERGSYLGMSDIGRGIECLRSAVAGKLEHSFAVGPETLDGLHASGDLERIEDELKLQVTLQRGHWVEGGIANALSAAGVRFIPQLEIRTRYQDVPIQAHLDFTLVWGGKNPAVRILEIKSSKKLPRNLYTAHETQLYAQLGLLKILWNKNCFNLKDAQGALIHQNKTFPELAALVFGIQLPLNPEEANIEGWVVSIAPDDAKVFGPYEPSPDTLNVCLDVAARIWAAVSEIRAGNLSLDDVPFRGGFYPLCDWCAHGGGCPKFCGHDYSEYEALLSQRSELKTLIKSLEEETADLDNQIKAAYWRITEDETSGLKPGDWIAAGEKRFKVSIASDQSARLYVNTIKKGAKAGSGKSATPHEAADPAPLGKVA